MNSQKDKNVTERKDFKFTFKMGLLVYVALALIAIGIGLSIFWGFIKDYEDSMPVHGMDSVIEVFKDGDISEYFTTVTDLEINEFQDADAVKSGILAKYNEYLSGKEITFVKASTYTDKKPAYVIKADGVKIAQVNLTSTGRNESNFKIWGFDSLSLKAYYPTIITSTSVKVQVPEGTVVTVNGKELGESYVTGTEEVKTLSAVAEYIERVPNLISYEVTGFYSEPEVKAVLNGKNIELTDVDGVLTGTFNCTDEFETEMTPYLDKVITAYAKKFINVDTRSVYNYVMNPSELRTSIKSITTYFYPNSKIESYGFEEKIVDNFQIYSDDCFSCDVKYTLKIDFVSGYYVEDPTEKGNFKFFFVLKDGTWYLTAMNYK